MSPLAAAAEFDPIDQRLVERDIDPHRSTGIGKQRDGEQHGTGFDGRGDILVEQNLVYGACRWHASACALNGFHVLAKRHGGIRNSLFHRVPSREAPFDVRKPYAEGAVRLLFDDSHIVRRHCSDTPRLSRYDLSISLAHPSGPPAGQLVDPPHETGRQIPSRVGHSDDRVPLGMLECVMIAVDPIENPAVILQHPDQLATVPFHAARFRSIAQNTALDLGHARAGATPVRVYNSK